MSRRLEIELTSNREDGSFTWRAAGAREPKGVVESKLLPDNVRVGDVLRAEVDLDVDGISVMAILPPKQKSGVSGLIEIVGTQKPFEPVTTTLAGKGDRGPRTGRGSDRPPRDRARGDRPGGPRAPGDSPERPGGERRMPDRGERGRREPVRGREHREGEGRRGRDVAAAGSRPSGVRAPGEGRPPSRARPGEGGERSRRPDDLDEAGAGARGEGGRPGSGGGEHAGEARVGQRSRQHQHRFAPGRARLDAVLSALPPEQRPIADQLAAGGLPAVRRALATAPASGESAGPSNSAAIIALAEQLLPAIKEAMWLDRAEAAVAALDHLSLRDLRATVIGATARDEHGRELDRRLREALDQRVTKLRETWSSDMSRALADGRVLQALRLSSRPPEPTARFPGSLVKELAEAAGSSMTAETPPERWLALLEAASASPIRRTIKPQALPIGADEAVLEKARAAAAQLPALAGLLGMAMPPPPRPLPGQPISQHPRPPLRSGRPGPQRVRDDRVARETRQQVPERPPESAREAVPAPAVEQAEQAEPAVPEALAIAPSEPAAAGAGPDSAPPEVSEHQSAEPQPAESQAAEPQPAEPAGCRTPACRPTSRRAASPRNTARRNTARRNTVR